MINIKDIIPFMRNGWVAMDKDGEWWWYNIKPHIKDYQWENLYDKNSLVGWIDKNCFDIAPAEDWTKSLIKVENK